VADIDHAPRNSDRHADPVTAGRLLAGRYRLTEPLATGGMAQVWEADDGVLGRRVAVKVLHRHLADDPVFLERFRSEARLAARLSHPGIVSIFDTVTEPGVEAIVMELLEGVDLRVFLDEHGSLSPQLTRELGAQVAEAIHAAHQAGLVHRDIKPGNIMLVDDRRMKVTDFGIAKPSAGQDLTDHGTLIGTAKYLAPEQVEGGSVDGRADVYALGVVLYECLTGQAPFSGDTNLAIALARLHRDPPRVRSSRGTVPPSLDAVVHRAMAREPDDRYVSAAELRAALLAADDATVLTEAPVDSTTLVAAEPPAALLTTERRWIVPTVLIVVIAVALAVSGALIGTTDVGRSAVTRAREAVGLEETTPALGDRETPDDPSDADVIDSPTAAPRVVAVGTFDPEGTGVPGENDDEVARTVDGDPTTSWTTEGYDSRDLGGLKAGVGVVIELDQEVSVDIVAIESPTQGWAAELYLVTEVPDSRAGWGSALVTQSGINGSLRAELGGTAARAMLLWITDLGDGPAPVRAEINEIVLFPG
jgi:tRNA A-37 threonylcarbamoyl transferase component Bud32